ncbi:MAG: sulfotransferase family 2 domain-containing protein [Candidatus Sumerlaeia bacterium]|nr:sulfotransferase family 2 domain-containing protein [Candidatus Sumerlaeia bacterium]
MVSHAHRCIFIHIPKTGGTSIERKLGHFKEYKRGVQDHRTIREVEPLTIPALMRLLRQPVAHQSRKAHLRRYLRSTFRGDAELTPEQYQSYLKFTIVRNPWARVFSWYHNVIRDPVHRQQFGVAEDCSFESFVLRHMSDAQHPLMPQLYWLRDSRGQVPMDFVGRFFRLQSAFEHVCDALGIEDARLPRLLPGSGLDYRDFYTDQMIRLVGDRYRDDIDFFGFEFEVGM